MLSLHLTHIKRVTLAISSSMWVDKSFSYILPELWVYMKWEDLYFFVIQISLELLGLKECVGNIERHFVITTIDWKVVIIESRSNYPTDIYLSVSLLKDFRALNLLFNIILSKVNNITKTLSQISLWDGCFDILKSRSLKYQQI